MRLWHCIVLRPGLSGFAILGIVDPEARLRTGGDGTRHSHREVVRPDFLDGPPRHPDLCLWYVRLWPYAAEDKSRTAFLAPGASMVLSILMATHHTVGGRLLVLFRGLRIPEEPSPDGAGIPIEGATYWYGAHFLLRRFAPAP